MVMVVSVCVNSKMMPIDTVRVSNEQQLVVRLERAESLRGCTRGTLRLDLKSAARADVTMAPLIRE